jgi:hypothetical protein
MRKNERMEREEKFEVKNERIERIKLQSGRTERSLERT